MSFEQAVHEVCHGIIAVVNGYQLDAVRLDGPPHHPGKTDRTIPGGKDGNDPEWARKELALFAAGYVGEEVIFGKHDPKHIQGHPESDYPMMLQCALVCGQNQADIGKVLAYRDPTKRFATPRHLWRTNVAINWKPYEKLIHTVQEEVRDELRKYESIIGPLAEWLMQKKVVSGEDFAQKMKELAAAHLKPPAGAGTDVQEASPKQPDA